MVTTRDEDTHDEEVKEPESVPESAEEPKDRGNRGAEKTRSLRPRDKLKPPSKFYK